jgi:hypothetical protein
MTSELKRLIGNARARLGGYELPADQAAENRRRKAIEDFQILLAEKIKLDTRSELLPAGEYVWLENRPAIRFEVDGHTFVIAGGKQECELSEECGGQSLPLARLAIFRFPVR